MVFFFSFFFFLGSIPLESKSRLFEPEQTYNKLTNLKKLNPIKTPHWRSLTIMNWKRTSVAV